MINQWILLYLFLTFGSGIFSLGVAMMLSIRHASSLLIYYLSFYIVFSFNMAVDTTLSYIRVNLPVIMPDEGLIVGLNYANLVSLYGIVFTLPLFAHELFACSSRKRRNRIVGILAVGGYLFYHARIAFFVMFGKHSPSLSLVLDLHLIAVGLYCFFLSLQYYCASKNQPHARISGIILILFACTVGVIIEDEFIGMVVFPVYPFVYASFGLVFSVHFFTVYWPQHHVPREETAPQRVRQVVEPNVSPEKPLLSSESPPLSSYDEFCAQAQLSCREKEVLLLLLQGRTNSQIATQLFISVNTAKTHIKNIYQKVGVNRRYELLASCRNFSLPSTSEEPLSFPCQKENTTSHPKG